MIKRRWVASSVALLVLAVGAFTAPGCSSKDGLDGGACSETQMDCSGSCVDLRSDQRHCGACSVSCKQGEVCSSGICGCPTGMMTCGSACTDVKTDAKNCGACGKACGAGETCSGGTCMTGCANGQMKCGASCTNTMTDLANCGICGKACGQMEICAGGVCQSCGDGGVQTVCTGDGGAYCANLQTDKANCGMCGKPCVGNETCQAGTCKPPCMPAWLSSNQSWTQNNLTYASEILNNTYNPTNLLDNVLTTRWVTSSTTNQWVIFNFGAPATLSGIQILNQANYTANAGGKDTILQTASSLNGPWTNVTSFQVANQQNSFQMFNFQSATSQYWRVFVQNNWGYQSYIQFMEVGFYGCL